MFKFLSKYENIKFNFTFNILNTKTLLKEKFKAPSQLSLSTVIFLLKIESKALVSNQI